MKNNKTGYKRIILIFMLVFALLGFVLSAYLAYEYNQPEPIGCPVSSTSTNSCETVRQSPYSELFGIKLPFWGAAYFLTTIALITLNLFRDNKKFLYGLIILTIAGLAFETTMTLIQIFIIEAICTWCIMTEVASITLVALGINLHFIKDK